MKTGHHIGVFNWKVHVTYWIGVIFVWLFFAFLFEGVLWEPFINKLGYLPSQLLVTYSVLYVLLPQFQSREYVRSILGFIFVTYFATVLARFLKIYFYESLTGYNSEKESIMEILTQSDPLLVQYLIWVFLTPAMTIGIVLIYNHYQERDLVAQLKNQRNQSELQFLQAQLHPHFLFNTLNNLYTLSIQQSPMTTVVAKRLHDLLDHMFNHQDQQLIPLQKEIDLVTHYIELERLRYGDRLDLTKTVRIIQPDVGVVPFMILSLVENAFKHGASKDPGKPYIKITIKEENDWLHCQITNSVFSRVQKDESGYTKGIGVKNISRQLELLYPDQHSYTVEETKDRYSVSLKIALRKINETEMNDE